MRLIDADAVAEAIKDEITEAKGIDADPNFIAGLKPGLAYINTAQRRQAMNWVRVEDRPPALGKMVLVTIHGSDLIQLQPGETLEEAVERTRKGFRRVTIGMLDGEGEWTGPDGWPMVVKPVAWAPLPEPWEEEENATD